MPVERESVAERLRDLPPRLRLLVGRLLAAMVVWAVATPAEWLVPVVRTAGGRRGVHLGPVVVSLLAVAAAVEALDRQQAADRPVAPRPDRGGGSPARSLWGRARVDAELFVVAAVPAAAGLVPGLVVLPRRSPLWGWAVSAVGRLAVAVVLALDNERSKRREATAGRPT